MLINLADSYFSAANGGIDLEEMNKNDPLVVLIHGAGMDRTVWFQQTRFLSHHGYRCFAVDLPAHGGTEGPPLKTINEMAEWISSVIERLGGPAHIVGHSMGSFIALATAANHPDSVLSATLIAVAEGMPVHPDLQTAADENLPKGASFIAGWGHGPDQHLGGNPTPGLWMIGGATAVVENSKPGILSLDLSICSSYEETLQQAQSVKCPTTLILGSRDKMTPRRAAQPLIDALTEPTVIELEGVGHMSMTEAPKEVRQVLLDNFSNI